MDCGPASLKMIAKFYGRKISLQELRDRMQIGKEGVSLLGVSDTAEAIGFRTYPAKLTYQSLVRDATLPAILHWNQNHFVVLYKVKKDKVFVADPGEGLVSMTANDFKAQWISDREDGQGKGIALLLEPSKTFYDQHNESLAFEKTEKSNNGLYFANIFQYIIRYKKLFVQLVVGLLVASLLQLFLPFLTQSVVDTGINTANIHFVYIILIAQLALFAGRLTVDFIRSWILLHISTRINISILADFLIKLMKLPISFFDSKHTGDILQRMNDHKRIETFLTGSSLNILFSMLNLVIFSVVLAFFNTGVFAAFATSSILYMAWVLIFLKKRKTLDYQRFGVAAKGQGITIQLVQGMQDIKLNGAERSMRGSWERIQTRIFELDMKSLSINQWQQAGAFFINEGKNIFITFLSAKAVIEGQMTLGTMLAVQYIIGQLNSPIEQMVGFIQSWQNAKISMDRLNEIHKMDDEEIESQFQQQEIPPSFLQRVVGGNDVKSANILSGSYLEMQTGDTSTDRQATTSSFSNGNMDVSSISMRDLTFVYPGAGNEPVLKDINLLIPKGKTTAIVGSSGSGKTTLLKLLLKFYEPQKGEIRVGDISLYNISAKKWREHCGVVMQESFIFSDTIAKNIAVGQERVDMNRLRHAAEIANIQTFIDSLPLGFNTKIGLEGTGISMGQKQRILIARSVYRDPDFILFDEATNSLDANNEKTIIGNLESFFKGRTVVIVAHRLSTVNNADQIIVLNKGTITERGTHQELTNLKGEYYQLVKNQLELGA